MVEKDMVKVLFSFDEQGWIIGYQSEFFDGKAWQAPFDTTNAVEISQSDLNGISLGATKLIDGKLVLDTSKQAELESEANKAIPSSEQLVINQLGLTIADLQKQVKELGGNA